jgi:biotin carboxyl carrier protein
LNNALAHQSIPFLPLQRRLVNLGNAAGRQPVATLLGVLGLTTALALLALVPADFTVQVEGSLQPQVRRHIFAPSDGVVEDVRVQHGDSTTKGDLLLRVRNAALDLDQSRLSGNLQTAQAKRDAVRTTRSRPDNSADSTEQDRLASEEQQLVSQIEGLENQLAIARRFRDELNVSSPLTGVVLTWNPHQLLDDRPVKQGQLLLTVADPSGPWILELRVPDREAGHVLAGRKRNQSDLPVTFLLASDPAVTHRGHLERLAVATDPAGGRPAVDAVVAIDDSLPTDARAGTHVVARIHCGRRSIGYVWLHDLIDFVRTSLFF